MQTVNTGSGFNDQARESAFAALRLAFDHA
jgi:hypothetical protein